MHPRANPDLRSKPMGDETLLHDAANRKVHVLNETALEILKLCDGTRDAHQIAAQLSRKTDADRDRVLRDVTASLETFRKLNLTL